MSIFPNIIRLNSFKPKLTSISGWSLVSRCALVPCSAFLTVRSRVPVQTLGPWWSCGAWKPNKNKKRASVFCFGKYPLRRRFLVPNTKKRIEIEKVKAKLYEIHHNGNSYLQQLALLDLQLNKMLWVKSPMTANSVASFAAALRAEDGYSWFLLVSVHYETMKTTCFAGGWHSFYVCPV